GAGSLGGPQNGSQGRTMSPSRIRPIRLRLHGGTWDLPIRGLVGPSSAAQGMGSESVGAPRMVRLPLSKQSGREDPGGCSRSRRPPGVVPTPPTPGAQTGRRGGAGPAGGSLGGKDPAGRFPVQRARPVGTYTPGFQSTSGHHADP